MRIRALFCTIIDLFYDDDLFASLAALEDDSNLSVSPLMAWSGEEPKWVLFRACRLEERVRRLYNDRKETKIVTFDHLDNILEYPLALAGTGYCRHLDGVSSHPDIAENNYTDVPIGHYRIWN